MTGMFVAEINFVNLSTWAKTDDQMTGDKPGHVRLYILLFYLFTSLLSWYILAKTAPVFGLFFPKSLLIQCYLGYDWEKQVHKFTNSQANLMNNC